MDRIRPLSVELLERLDATLRGVDAEPLQGAGPGLSSDELRRLAADLPAPLPDELALWWMSRTWGAGLLLPDAQFGPLDACIDHYRFRRNWAQENAPESADKWWHPLWFPLLPEDGGTVIAVDLALADAETAPLRLIDWQLYSSDHFGRVIAPSLGSFVADRLDAIDAGDYVYDDHVKIWRRAEQ